MTTLFCFPLTTIPKFKTNDLVIRLNIYCIHLKVQKKEKNNCKLYFNNSPYKIIT